MVTSQRSVKRERTIGIPPATSKVHMGILPGGLVNLEERDGQVVLTPAAVVEIEMYSDAKIQRLADDDTWKPGEKQAWRRRLKGRKA